MNKKHTTLIFYLSILTAVLVLASFVFFFQIIKNKNHHTSAVLTTLDEKITKKSNMDTLEKRIAELEVTRNAMAGYFVDSNQIDSFISYLEGLGTSTGSELEVKSVEISTDEKNTVLGQVTVTGTFNQVMQTLTLLENIPYQVYISAIYLNKDVRSVSTEVNGKTVNTTNSFWQADVSFKILSS